MDRGKSLSHHPRSAMGGSDRSGGSGVKGSKAQVASGKVGGSGSDKYNSPIAIWSGWLNKISLKARKWGRKERFFRLVRVSVQGGQDFFEIRYFRNDEDRSAENRLGTINLFKAAGVCWFGNYTKSEETACIICIPTPSRVWFLKGSKIEQITHFMTKLSNIVPQIAIRAHGIVEFPRKQRFIKMKSDWKRRYIVGLSNFQMLVFNNDKMEDYEGASLLSNYTTVQRDRDDATGRELLTCALRQGAQYERTDGSGKMIPCVLSAPARVKSSRESEKIISVEKWYSLIRQAIAYRLRREGLSSSDIQLVSLVEQIKNRDYRATSHAIHATRVGVPEKMRFKLWCGFSGAERRPRGILSKIEQQQRRWHQERDRVASSSSSNEVESGENTKVEIAQSSSPATTGVDERSVRRVVVRRLIDAFEIHNAERRNLATHHARIGDEDREKLTKIALFVLDNLAGGDGAHSASDAGSGVSTPSKSGPREISASSTLEDAAFRVLVALTEDVVPRYFNGLNEHDVDARTFEALASERYAPLTEHLRMIGVKWREPASVWFRSLFVDIACSNVCCRLWDALMVEGPVALVRLGLAFVRLRRERLLLLPNVPSSRSKALRLLDISKFGIANDIEDTDDDAKPSARNATNRDERQLLQYAFQEMDSVTQRELRKAITSAAQSKMAAMGTTTTTTTTSSSSSSSSLASVSSGSTDSIASLKKTPMVGSRGTAMRPPPDELGVTNRKAASVTRQDDLHIAMAVATDIYWDVPQDTALFRLLVDGLFFAARFEKYRREEWRKVARQAKGWEEKCDDMHGLANEVCILGTKFSKYATDLAQILLDLMSVAHKLPAGYCDERLLPSSVATANKKKALVMHRQWGVMATTLAAVTTREAAGRDSISLSPTLRPTRNGAAPGGGVGMTTTSSESGEGGLLVTSAPSNDDTAPRKRVLSSTERLYEMVIRIHRTMVNASSEASEVKRTQRRWQRELNRVCNIAALAADGRDFMNPTFGGDEFANAKADVASHRRRRMTRHAQRLTKQNRGDLRHLTDCRARGVAAASTTATTAAFDGPDRNPQDVVVGLGHAMICAAWTALSSCWACDQERYWMNHIEKSFLLKDDSPVSQSSPHRKLRKLLVHMRMKFRIVAEEIVQRLQRMLALVWQQLQNARRSSEVAELEDARSEGGPSGRCEGSVPALRSIERILPRLLEGLSKISHARSPSRRRKTRQSRGRRG